MKAMHGWILWAVLAAAAAAGADGSAPYVQTRDIQYGEMDGVGLLMDVFAPVQPGGAGQGLGIVCVTSGAWKSDRGMMDAHQRIGIFDVLCGHGFTVFAVRPGTLSGFTGEQMLAHINIGIRFVKSHAAEYHVDPARLGLTGTSAGGHLALLAATRAEAGDPQAEDAPERLDTRMAAVGVFCPPTDFMNWNGKPFGLDLMDWRLAFRDGAAGKTQAQKEAAATALSPLRQVKAGLPPMLLVHGDADSVIPVQQSVDMAKALQAAGNTVELIIKKGADHSWPTMREDFAHLAQWFGTVLAPPKAAS